MTWKLPAALLSPVCEIQSHSILMSLNPRACAAYIRYCLFGDWMPLSLQPRGCHYGQQCVQENSLLRDELTTSKSTILHLIHELNQAKNQTRTAAASHSGSRLQGKIVTLWHNIIRLFACYYKLCNTKHLFQVRMQPVTSASCRVLYTHVHSLEGFTHPHCCSLYRHHNN